MRSTLQIALAAALLLSAAPAMAQSLSDARFGTTTLDISGHGEARTPPDQATIVLGVTTQALTAVAAMQANAADMTKVVGPCAPAASQRPTSRPPPSRSHPNTPTPRAPRRGSPATRRPTR